MIDLTSVPATQDPSSPMIVCRTTMAVVTSATDGGLLSPLRECAIAWRQRPERHQPQEDAEHTQTQPQWRHGSRFRVLARGRFIRHVCPTLFGVPRVPTRRTRDGAESTLLA